MSQVRVGNQVLKIGPNMLQEGNIAVNNIQQQKSLQNNNVNNREKQEHQARDQKNESNGSITFDRWQSQEFNQNIGNQESQADKNNSSVFQSWFSNWQRKRIKIEDSWDKQRPSFEAWKQVFETACKQNSNQKQTLSNAGSTPQRSNLRNFFLPAVPGQKERLMYGLKRKHKSD
eukprot:TRINITY_DN8253_c0_g1_i2.p3 TRINITY_DN8253_c0_g1~~TRINITY_DN8253_c0_g1_i2.p3  ORF type:complete len:174 (+),score=24.43 TRINITY_DN8253_c0_g1_i2:791-1312(+)